uniref:Aminotransferase-like plant mobile domain-containing protein n=1 Tax=Fagus sylvatica TaxID=28930 RepID=A0A2N9HQI4_FAGSY
MRGGRVGFIENRARLARSHHARRMTVLRELWYCHVAVLSFHASSCLESSSISRARTSFFIRFSGAVLEVFRNSKWVMRHIVGKLSTSSFQRYKVCANRSSDEGVMAPGSRGIGAVFVHSFPVKIPVKRGMLSANREFHDVAGVIIFPTHPGSRINLLRAGKTLRAKAAVREKKCVLLPAPCAAYFCKVPDSRESELGLVRYGPASRVHRGVFGPFEGSFPIRIPADPDKFLAIREFHVVHGCVLFPMCPGSQINLLRVRKTLCASVATSVGKFRKFQHSLISSACFHARGRRSSRCRISDDLGPVKPWSNLVNLGQTWSKLWSKLSKLLEMYPGLHFKGFWARWTLVGLETARSNLGQTSVNPSQTWSTLVKLGQTLGNVSRTFFLGVFDAESPRRIRPAWFGLSRFARRHSEKIPGMSDRGSGSGGHRRSDRLAKGKAVVYAPESSPDTDDERSSMPRLLVLLLVRLGLLLDLESSLVVVLGPSETTRPSPQPGVTTGPSDAPSAAPRRPHTRSTGIPSSRLKRQRTGGIPDSAGTIPEDYVAPGFRYPPQGGIRPRYPVAVEISDTPLLTNLLAHPSSLVRRCQEPPESAGRGGWSEFSRLLAASRPEYREFLIELGFGPFLSIPYVSVYHPAVWCFIERFFHHTGTFHLSTCEMAVLPVDWSAILGIRFGGRAPPSEPIDGFEAREILGLADRDAIEGSRRPSVRIRHLADVLRRDREEPPTELRYRQWAAYLIFSCFLGNDRSIVPTPIVGMFRDIDTLREYDWGALTYGFYIRGLRRYSRRESISFLGFWQFTVFWAFEHFPTFAPSRLPLASDPDFPLARRWDSSRIERMTARTLLELRMTGCSVVSSEAVDPDLSVLGASVGTYIPRAPSDPYIAGVSAYPSLVREDVPYQEWFERVSLGSLMSLHEVEGGRVMGGVAMDSHLIRSSGQIERLESEILRLQLELSVSVDRHTADMDRVQGEMASMQTEATQREGEMVQMRRDLASRDAEVARLAAAVRRLEEQLQGMGITPVTGADPSGLGQPSSSPPRDPVSRDWFFDDPPSS